MLSTGTIKEIDRLLGPGLLKLCPKTPPKSGLPARFKKVLVIRPGGMGDAILLLPVLKTVFKLYRTSIDLLCEPRNSVIFSNVDFVNAIYSYKSLKDVLSMSRNRYDAIIDTEQSHFLSAIMTKFLNAGIKIGFSTYSRNKIYHKSVPYRQNVYEAQMFWTLFQKIFNLPEFSMTDFPYFKLTASSVKKNIVCLFPGATTPERHWPEKRWAKICDWILRNKKTPVLLGGKLEIPLCSQIIRHCTIPGTINLSGRLSIAETIQLFSKAEQLVSTDSGILHLAVLCGLPTISLFGPSNPEKWGPKGKKDQIVHKNCFCSPCASFGTIPACKNKNICMMRITPSDVLNRLKKSE